MKSIFLYLDLDIKNIIKMEYNYEFVLCIIIIYDMISLDVIVRIVLQFRVDFMKGGIKMSTHASQEKEGKVYTDDNPDFGEFGIIERTDESNGYSEEEIISLLKSLAKKLKKPLKVNGETQF